MAGQLGGLGVHAFAGLVLARILGPTVYGVWQAMFTANYWIGRFHLGSLSTLSRELPVALDRGGQQEAADLNRAACSVFFFTCLVLGGAGVVLALFTDSRHAFAWALLCAAFPLVAVRFYAYERLAAEMRFAKRTVVVILPAVVFLATSWPLAIEYGINGVATANMMQAVLTVAVLGLVMGILPRLTFKGADLIRVVKAGWVFWLASLLAVLDGTAGRLLVLAMMPSKDLGLYGLAMTAALPLVTLAASLETALRPRLMIMRARGEAGDQVEFRPLPAVPNTAWGVVALQGMAFCLAPDLVAWLLPEYLDALPALRIMIAAAWFPFAALGCESLLMAANAGRAILIGQGVSALAKLGLGFWLVLSGLGVAGMAAAFLAGELIKAVWLLGSAWPHMKGTPKKGWLELVFFNAPLALASIVLLIAQSGLALIADGNLAFKGLWSAILYLALGGALAYLIHKILNRVALAHRPPDHRRLPFVGF